MVKEEQLVEIEKRANQILQQLTLSEKAELCSGRDFWKLKGIDRFDLPEIMLSDGPHGLRKQAEGGDHLGLNKSVKATCFPTASGLAATWNRSLVLRIGEALGRECAAENVATLLGPGVNIKRHPLGGRNFEYFSEDPFLTGELAKAWIKGVQSEGVGASLKHYAVNNHERARMVVDAVVDQRALREIYLPGHESAVVGARPWTVMCSYNKLNGIYLSEHHELLTNILRGEWQFDGIVVTDWGALNDPVKGIQAGLDLEMPSSGTANTKVILNALKDGALSESDLDAAVTRILIFILRSKTASNLRHTVDWEAHHQLAREAAAESCVLLKNENGLLPIGKDRKIMVVGSFAIDTRYQGAGSSQINPHSLEQPLEEFKKALGEDNVTYASGYSSDENTRTKDLEKIVTKSCDFERIILIVGLTPSCESEGFDRDHMRLPQEQLDLIKKMRPLYHKLIVVVQNGSPVELPFADEVPVILEAYLGGQAGASAMVKIILGDINPSGKLAETFPLSLKSVASNRWFNGDPRQTQYRESIWVGYRYFDTAKIPVAFPFGHGLSYTTFEYSELNFSTENDSKTQTTKETNSSVSAITPNRQYRVSFIVTNTGSRSGAEVAQCYVGQPNPSVPRPTRELRQFQKVMLDPGQSKRIELFLSERDFSYWSAEDCSWIAESDCYELYIGSSIADIRLQKSIQLNTKHAKREKTEGLDSYFTANLKTVNDSEYERLLGRPIPTPTPVYPFHPNTMLSEIQGTWLGRQLLASVLKNMMGTLGGEEELSQTNQRLMHQIVREMPLRNLMNYSDDKLTADMLYRIIHMLNGDYWKATCGTKIDGR